MGWRNILLGLGICLFAIVLCPLVRAKVDTGLVYYGDSEQDYYAPGEIDCAEIFVQIPEYRKILEENLDTKSGKYWTLLRKANDKFQVAVRKTAKNHGLDLICETGQVSEQVRKTLDKDYKMDYTEDVKKVVEEIL